VTELPRYIRRRVEGVDLWVCNALHGGSSISMMVQRLLMVERGGWGRRKKEGSKFGGKS